MVSFQCEGCGDIFTKKKLDQHFNRCRAPFTCIDCMQTFQGTSWKSHTSCMSEAQKYQGALYKEPKKGNTKPSNNTSNNNNPAQTSQGQVHPSRQAYVESASDSSSKDNSQTLVQSRHHIPPPAPSPPAASIAEAEALNIYDYLSKDKEPISGKKDKDKKRKSNPNTEDPAYSYGEGPIPTTTTTKTTPMPTLTPTIVTARPSAALTSDKKRKRTTEATAPTTDSTRHHLLHSGLTGGLQRMLSAPEEEEDNDNDTTTSDSHPAQSTPLAEKTKRGKRQKNDDEDSSSRRRQREEEIEAEIRRLERKKEKAAARRRLEVGGEDRKMVGYHSPTGTAATGRTGRGRAKGPAEGFLKLVTDERKSGASSSKGQSVWGALKMWRDDDGAEDVGAGEEKKLWKGLRMRMNERGEVVLFAKEE